MEAYLALYVIVWELCWGGLFFKENKIVFYYAWFYSLPCCIVRLDFSNETEKLNELMV